jgi:hypothetical protein
MDRTIASLLTGVLLTGISLAQSSVDAQGSGSASQDTSVSANKSGAQAKSETSATATHDASVSGKNRQMQATNSGQLTSGSTFQAELVKPVDARKSKPGDEVVAKTTQDVKSDGQVIIPKGSRLIGKVTEAKAAGKGESGSQVGIAFERAILKDGTQVPMAVGIQAISNSQSEAAAGDGSLMTSGNAGGMAGASRAAGRGALGGVTSGAGALVNSTGGAAGGALHSAHGTSATAAGGLTSDSQGVIGMSGMSLSSAGSSATSGSGVISSRNGNVRLDSGTRMLLLVNH